MYLTWYEKLLTRTKVIYSSRREYENTTQLFKSGCYKMSILDLCKVRYTITPMPGSTFGEIMKMIAQ